MQVAILAGGMGSRLSEETIEKPKAMVEIGGRPILWHIMMHYAAHGFNDFVIALGYMGDVIKESVKKNRKGTDGNMPLKNGSVKLVDTGISTRNGGRIKRLAPHLKNGTFMLTWCDGLSDIRINELLAFHRSHGKLATLTAVHPPERFGHVEIDGDTVTRFVEKPKVKDRWINGAFFVLEPKIFEYIDSDDIQWEKEPMERLAAEGQLMAYRHTSFWQCMDTIHDKVILEELWSTGQAPWKTWK